MRSISARPMRGGEVVLENERLRVVLDPAAGGKLRSLFSKSAGRELFYQDNRPTFSCEGYSQHDMSGYDECFPTVWACTIANGDLAGRELPDHGFLWSQAVGMCGRWVCRDHVVVCDLDQLRL